MKSGVLHKTFSIPGLFQPVYILPPGEVYTTALSEKNSAAICIDAASLFNQPDGKIVHQLAIGDRPFMLSLSSVFIDSVNKTDKKIWLEKISLLFFSKNYILDQEKPVIALLKNDDALLTKLKAEMEQFTIGQGIDGLVFWQIQLVESFEEQVGKSRFPLVIKNSIEINNSAIDYYFADPENLGTPVFFIWQDFAIDYAADSFQTACADYLAHNPVLKTIIIKYLRSKQSARLLEKENRLLQHRLGNANSFVELAKSKYKNDYDELFTFYHNEYEVLPLWYKRFGHIIKVLMGKRSLRSLFSDNVKKYRD